MIHKKKIIIPKIERDEEGYVNMVKNNKEKINKISQKRGHFIWYFIFKDKYPLEHEYNVDEEDL